MSKIGKIKTSERKDHRGGGYSRRKLTDSEAKLIRQEYEEGAGGTVTQMAKRYNVSQPLMYQLLNYVTYNE